MDDIPHGGLSGVTTDSNTSTHQETHIDIYETEDALRVVADIPGATEIDIT